MAQTPSLVVYMDPLKHILGSVPSTLKPVQDGRAEDQISNPPTTGVHC